MRLNYIFNEIGLAELRVYEQMLSNTRPLFYEQVLACLKFYIRGYTYLVDLAGPLEKEERLQFLHDRFSSYFKSSRLVQREITAWWVCVNTTEQSFHFDFLSEADARHWLLSSPFPAYFLGYGTFTVSRRQKCLW